MTSTVCRFCLGAYQTPSFCIQPSRLLRAAWSFSDWLHIASSCCLFSQKEMAPIPIRDTLKAASKSKILTMFSLFSRMCGILSSKIN